MSDPKDQKTWDEILAETLAFYPPTDRPACKHAPGDTCGPECLATLREERDRFKANWDAIKSQQKDARQYREFLTATVAAQAQEIATLKAERDNLRSLTADTCIDCQHWRALHYPDGCVAVLNAGGECGCNKFAGQTHAR